MSGTGERGALRSDGCTPAEVEVPIRRDLLPSRVAVSCLAVTLALPVLDFVCDPARIAVSEPLRELTDLTEPRGLASWFVDTLLSMITLTSLLIAVIVPRVRRSRWLALTGLWAVVTLYHGLLLHGRLMDIGEAVRRGRVSVGRGLSWLAQPALGLDLWEVLLLALLGASAVYGLTVLRGASPTPRGRAAAVVAGIMLLLWVGLAVAGCRGSEPAESAAVIVAMVTLSLAWSVLLERAAHAADAIDVRVSGS